MPADPFRDASVPEDGAVQGDGQRQVDSAHPEPDSGGRQEEVATDPDDPRETERFLKGLRQPGRVQRTADWVGTQDQPEEPF